MATDYDELRTDVKESQENSLEALKTAKAPDAKSVVQELDEADVSDGLTPPGGEFIAEELIVQVIPQADDEFTCYSCFLVRHRSQKAREKDGHAYCVECEAERFWPAVPEHIWDSIREEFTLSPVSELETHFQFLGDPEAMRRAVRVFIGEGTFCPGFQLKDGLFHERAAPLWPGDGLEDSTQRVRRLDGQPAACRIRFQTRRPAGQHGVAPELPGCLR